MTPYCKKIHQYSLDDIFIKKWDSTNLVFSELNILAKSVRNCCNNKYGYKTAGGFKWKYYDTRTQ